jgi:hypothetical protein
MSTLAPVLLTARYERQIVKAFRNQRAVSGRTAQRLRDLGLKDSAVLRQLITATIVRKAGPERYFLHEQTWVARGHLSWRTVGFIMLAAGLAAATGLYLLER